MANCDKCKILKLPPSKVINEDRLRTNKAIENSMTKPSGIRLEKN